MLLVAPAALMSLYGVALDGAGAFVGRILGAALISLATIFWFAKDTPDGQMRRVLAWSNATLNGLEVVIIVTATLLGTINALGWFATALHTALTIAFGYTAMTEHRRT
jgi:hypothetical protein